MWYFILNKKDTVWLGQVDKLITVAVVCALFACVSVWSIKPKSKKYKNKQFHCKEREKILCVSATQLFLQIKEKEVW